MTKPQLHPGLTASQVDTLLAQATRTAEHSYSPYSHFRVGAALLLEGGQIVTGTNVENASYRLTTCAEQAAIASAIAAHGPAIRIRAVAIANLNGEPCQPCGACRQTIAEFASPDTPIFFPAAGEAGVTIARLTLAELLPASFSLKA